MRHNPYKTPRRLDYDNRYTILHEEFTWKDYKTLGQVTTAKPSGLWFAPGDEWLKFIDTSGFDSRKITSFAYQVNIDFDQVKIISNLKEAKDFGEQYGEVFTAKWRKSTEGSIHRVMWQKVAEDFDGIELQNYHDYRRLQHNAWLYDWDLDSGCIWNRTALLDIEFLGTVEFEFTERESDE